MASNFKQKDIMKKKINIQFILLSSFAVVVTAAASMALFYSIFKNQVYDDIKDYTHIIRAYEPEFLKSDKNREFLKKDGIRVTFIQKDGSVSYDSSMGQKAMENHKGRPEIQEALRQEAALQSGGPLPVPCILFIMRSGWKTGQS